VLTIHDAIADSLPSLIFANWKSRLFWRMKQYLAIRRADIIVTVSEYSKQQIVNTLKVPEPRVRVISEGSSRAFRVLPDSQDTTILRRLGLSRDESFLLYVGGISPHKNLATLIEGYHQLLELPGHRDVRLVLAGDYKTDSFFSSYTQLQKQIASLNLGKAVIFTDFIEDSDLACLYNHAMLLVFPSLMEGFGLPAVEAMACGTPVAASNAGSLPEVLGDAGAFFDPHSTGSMLSVIKALLTDPGKRSQISKLGIARAANYSWKLGARQITSLFDELSRQ